MFYYTHYNHRRINEFDIRYSSEYRIRILKYRKCESNVEFESWNIENANRISNPNLKFEISNTNLESESQIWNFEYESRTRILNLKSRINISNIFDKGFVNRILHSLYEYRYSSTFGNSSKFSDLENWWFSLKITRLYRKPQEEFLSYRAPKDTNRKDFVHTFTF